MSYTRERWPFYGGARAECHNQPEIVNRDAIDFRRRDDGPRRNESLGLELLHKRAGAVFYREEHAMAEPRPSNRRLGRAAILVAVLVVAIAATIFVAFNIAHQQAMENQVEAQRAAPVSDNVTRP